MKPKRKTASQLMMEKNNRLMLKMDKERERKRRMGEIKEYARHYDQPITDLKGFNKLLKNQGFDTPVTKEQVAKLLKYI